jgi:hypothetical protein
MQTIPLHMSLAPVFTGEHGKMGSTPTSSAKISCFKIGTISDIQYTECTHYK